jgi:exodeoxyribonuclease V beta subunit
MQKSWAKLSYTMLASKGETIDRRSNKSSLEPYDTFIYYLLQRGVKTGNLLHYLFENIDYSADNYWSFYIAQTVKKYLPTQSNEMENMLLKLVNHVTTAEIKCSDVSFKLKQITTDKKLAEFEFDFNIQLFNPISLSELINNEVPVNLRYNEQLEGIMNGKVDLFFQHEDKYYILDWKSNYLGDELHCYSNALLYNVMTENNYHLQYLIYTVAIKKYLETRLPSFDYEKQFGGVIYLFIRGVRENTNNGIFFTKPSLGLIQKIESMLSVAVV